MDNPLHSIAGARTQISLQPVFGEEEIATTTDMTPTSRRWLKYVAAVILGNALYLLLSPLLPPRARHHSLVDWGTFVDLWFCLFIYGVIELAGFLLQPKDRP